mmetsp:Transcript_16276/g.61716  ORF Transcript_16276/g.61716 Transcript_16276/m.61716 type:complete len:229 (-) Transcript_16276:523-1209(-)
MKPPVRMKGSGSDPGRSRAVSLCSRAIRAAFAAAGRRLCSVSWHAARGQRLSEVCRDVIWPQAVDPLRVAVYVADGKVDCRVVALGGGAEHFAEARQPGDEVHEAKKGAAANGGAADTPPSVRALHQHDGHTASDVGDDERKRAAAAEVPPHALPARPKSEGFVVWTGPQQGNQSTNQTLKLVVSSERQRRLPCKGTSKLARTAASAVHSQASPLHTLTCFQLRTGQG